jgi:peptidoglycan/LPS O-acetylase OafA/YrhL
MTKAVTPLPTRNLDLLRAVAVLCVLADHVAIAATPPGNVAWGWVGRAGVLIFFVHTALVLMGSLERSGETRGHWIAQFYVRRALRIYPLAIAAILFVIALQIPVHTTHVGMRAPFIAPDRSTLAANLLLIQNLVRKRDIIGVLWTLPIEVQMYLTLPFCFLVARRSVWGIVLLFALAALATVARENQLNVPGLWRLSMLIYAPCFLSGVLAYALLRRRLATKISAGAWLLAVGVLFAAFFTVRAYYESSWAQWIFCLALGISISLATELSVSPVSRLAYVIAKYSYSIYLLHLPMLWIALVLFGRAPEPAQWLLFAVLMVVAPWIAFHLIERPGIWVGQRLVHQPMPKATPVGAP